MLNNKYIIIYLLFFQSLIFSQLGSTSFDVPISISVNSGLIIKNIAGDLDFGEVLSMNSTQSLSRDPEYGAKFEVNGIPRERISVDYSNSVVLDNSSWLASNSGNLDQISFIPNVRHTRRNENYINSRNLRNGRTIRLRNVNEVGKLYIWVGGDLEINPNQEIGEYVGTFNISVAY